MTAVEDPEKMLELAVSDMREQHTKAKQQVAVAIATEKRLQKELVLKQEDAAEWETKTMRALKAGQDDLAKTAMERKLQSEGDAKELQEQHEKALTGVNAVKSALMTLDKKITDADRKKRILISRQKRASAQKAINDTLQQLSSNDAGTVFGDMEGRIMQLEAEADASADLADMGPGSADAAINEQFKALEAGDVNEALEAMKQKLALAPAATGATKSDE
jgi:phage shock protein A